MGSRLYQTQQIWLQNHTWHNFSNKYDSAVADIQYVLETQVND